MDEKLAVFEQRMDQKLTSVAASMDKLAASVQLLAERDIRTQERESQQQQFNLRLGNSLDALTKEVSAIQLARADERHAMEAIKRAHPWILVFAVLGPMIATTAFGFWFKAAPAPIDQRAVVPLVQSYDPQNPPRNIQSAPASKR